MPYTKRPFQPETPYTNQVSIELNKANDNFNILSQAFVSNNPETLKVKEADTVDGFHASLTPGPNVIVPLNTSGVLDLSNAYVKSNVYTFRRVDLTGASQDYELQVGEEAYISFNNTTSVPLRIAIPSSGGVYQINAFISWMSGSNFDVILLVNNTTYSNQFGNWSLTYAGTAYHTSSFFFHDLYAGTADSAPYIITQYISALPNIRCCVLISGGQNTATVSYSVWNNNTTPWTSLGTWKDYSNKSFSGYLFIRRLS